MAEKIALVTGFEPYGGRGVNPAAEVVAFLDGQRIAGARVVGRKLPVSYRSLRGGIDRLLEELTPAAVISLGLWPGQPTIRLERIAVNVVDFEIADNEGTVLSDEAIDGNGPVAFRATLPFRAIEQALLTAGIPAHVSSTAGTFLCNATMFGFLQGLEGRGRVTPCGFIHLPYLPAQVADLLTQNQQERRLEMGQRADLSSMSLDDMVRAATIALEVTLGAKG